MKTFAALIDTHALLWLLGNSKTKSIGKNTHRILANADIVYVSSISIVEIHLKELLGKIDPIPGLHDVIAATGFVSLDFTADHAATLTDFPLLARHDAFDRMLLATAKAEKLTFLTADSMLLAMGLDFVQDVTE